MHPFWRVVFMSIVVDEPTRISSVYTVKLGTALCVNCSQDTAEMVRVNNYTEGMLNWTIYPEDMWEHFISLSDNFNLIFNNGFLM